MNTAIESLFPEEGEVIETENPRRNFAEVNLLLLLFFSSISVLQKQTNRKYHKISCDYNLNFI